MTQISRFIGEVVPVAQNVTGDGDESAAPEGGGGFADYALVSLHCLRIYLDTSYRMTIDLLKEMPQITGEIGLSAADLPCPSTLCKAFDRISMSICRVLLRQSAQLHDPSKHGTIDATFYERFREWADGEGVSLEPAFEVRRRSTLDSDDTDAFLVLPVLCLAIHVDGTLVSVAPHRTETGTHTVEDALTHIESMPRIREVGTVSELPPDHPARSVSVSKRS